MMKEAVIIEHSMDNGKTWQEGSITRDLGLAIIEADHIPWAVRYRRVSLKDEGIIPKKEVKETEEVVRKFEGI